MSQRFETHVQFVCPVCAAQVHTEVAVPEPDWGAAESSSELNSEGETEVDCPQCNAVFDAYVINSAGDCDIRLTQYEDTAVVADTAFFSPDEEDWSDYELPENPYSIWMSSYEQARTFLDAHGSEDGGALLNRMVFSQHVAALEAFLGDILIKTVLDDSKVILRLLENDTELRKDRVSLLDMQNNPNLVVERVGGYLKDIRYHNLAKVSVLYKIALGVDLLVEKNQTDRLFAAMQLRHDCVHRNGFNKDGVKLENFTKAYVSETAAEFGKLVARVNLALSPF